MQRVFLLLGPYQAVYHQADLTTVTIKLGFYKFSSCAQFICASKYSFHSICRKCKLDTIDQSSSSVKEANEKGLNL